MGDGPPEARPHGGDTEIYERLALRNGIRDYVERLLTNGDKWEENARKSWRREDAANQRWLEGTKRLGELGVQLQVAEWEAHLFADQRDRLLAHCNLVEAVRHQKMVPLDEIYDIMITDPRDGEVE